MVEAEALQREMARRGIEPNEYTDRVLKRTATELSRHRISVLGRLLTAGETAKAWELFDGLLGRGHANEHHLTVMLKTGLSMDEQRALVQRAEEADVATGVSTYTLLLSSARVEGRMEEAAALQQVMARRGIEPNDYTAKVMARSSEVLAKQRTSELGRLLKAGETSATLACLMGFNPTPPPRPRGTRPCAICLATVHKHLHTRGHTKAHSGSGNS